MCVPLRESHYAIKPRQNKSDNTLEVGHCEEITVNTEVASFLVREGLATHPILFIGFNLTFFRSSFLAFIPEVCQLNVIALSVQRMSACWTVMQRSDRAMGESRAASLGTPLN
jgi:hypothetical protein